MNKLELLTNDLLAKEAEVKEMRDGLSSITIAGIKHATENQIEEMEKDIESIKIEIEEVKAAEELTNKNWDKVIADFPIIAEALNDVKTLNEEIKFNTDFYKHTLTLVKTGKLKSILLYGVTGTGKTTMLRAFGRDCNKPILTVNASNGLKEEDVFGSYIIGDNGKPQFVLGPLLIAMITGCGFVIEEINGAKQSVLLKLNSVLDDLSQVYIKETGQTYKAAPGFFFGGTFNPGYAGTRKLNKAFVNRFQIVGEVKEMTETQLKNALRSKIKDVNDNELNVAWFIFKGVLNGLKLQGLDGAISIRQILSMINYYRVYNAEYTKANSGKKNKSWTQAIEYGVAGQVSGGDEDIKKLVSNVATSLYDNTDRATGLIKEANVIPGESADILKELKGRKEEM